MVMLLRRRGIESGHPITSGTHSPPSVASAGPANDTPQMNVPSGVMAGDLIIGVVGREWDAVVTPGPATLTIDGFTYGGVAYLYDEGWTSATFLFYKYATGVDSGIYQVHPDDGTGGHILATAAARITGGPTSGNPFVDGFQQASALSGATATIPSFTPGGDNSLILVAGWADDGPYTTYPGSPWVNNVNSNLSSGNLLIASLRQSSAAATGNLSYASSDDSMLIAATIRP